MARDRYLSMVEVADLMDLKRIKGKPDHYRAQYVRRLVRRIERIDGRPIITKRGKDCYIALSALERLAAWDPATLGEMRGNIDKLGRAQKHIRKQLNAHGAKLREHGQKIRDIEGFRQATAEYLAKVQAVL